MLTTLEDVRHLKEMLAGIREAKTVSAFDEKEEELRIIEDLHELEHEIRGDALSCRSAVDSIQTNERRGIKGGMWDHANRMSIAIATGATKEKSDIQILMDMEKDLLKEAEKIAACIQAVNKAYSDVCQAVAVCLKGSERDFHKNLHSVIGKAKKFHEVLVKVPDIFDQSYDVLVQKHKTISAVELLLGEEVFDIDVKKDASLSTFTKALDVLVGMPPKIVPPVIGTRRRMTTASSPTPSDRSMSSGASTPSDQSMSSRSSSSRSDMSESDGEDIKKNVQKGH